LPRAIRRSAPGQLAAVSPVLARLARFEIDAAVRATAAAYADPELCSLDAIHLATADQLRASGKTISAFVTYDSRLARAAHAAGFPAAAPEPGR
jgi:predicted nucleic acid-binding protein